MSKYFKHSNETILSSLKIYKKKGTDQLALIVNILVSRLRGSQLNFHTGVELFHN